MTAEAPAETIRRAAKKMRGRATAAVPGPWVQDTAYLSDVIAPVRGVPDDDPEHVAEGLLLADAEHIAGMHPGVALALADLLDAAARDADLGLDWTELHGTALDAAHIYLGEADRTYFEAPASE